MKKIVFLIWLIVSPLVLIAAVPRQEYGVNLNDIIARRRLVIHESSAQDLQFTYTNNGAALDLSGVNSVTFEYAPINGGWTQVVTGRVDNATNGVITIPLRSNHTATNGIFNWVISVSSGTVDIVKDPWGDLQLIDRPGGGSTNGFPTTTNVVDLAGYTFFNFPWVGAGIAGAAGDLTYYTGSLWTNLAAGTNGQFLGVSAGGVPTWSVPDWANITNVVEYFDFTIFVTNGTYDTQWIGPRQETYTLDYMWLQTIDSGTCTVALVQSASNAVLRIHTTNMVPVTGTTNEQYFSTWADSTWEAGTKLGYRVTGGSAAQCSGTIRAYR